MSIQRHRDVLYVRAMNLQIMPSIKLAAGHSGQNKTASRSEMRLSKIARYSASFEFFVVFVLPDLLNISHHVQVMIMRACPYL